MTASEGSAELVYYPVPGRIKVAYQGLVGKLSVKDIEQDLVSSYETLQRILLGLDFQVQGMVADSYLGLSKYAVNGDSEYLLICGTADKESLFDQVTRVVGMLELLQAFEEFCSAIEISAPLLLMLNMIRPRVEIDRARLGDGGAGDISLIELALLAGMKEASVRNCAVPGNPGFIRSFQSNGTKVRPVDAHEWLLKRRRYRPTQFPESDRDRALLLGYLKGIDS